MGLFVIAQVLTIFVTLSHGLSRRANSDSPIVVKSQDVVRGPFEKNPPLKTPPVQSGSHSSNGLYPKAPEFPNGGEPEGAKQPGREPPNAENLTAKNPSSQKSDNYSLPFPRFIGSYRTPGVSLAQEAYAEMSQNDGMGSIPNPACSEANGQAMVSSIQTISLNIESFLQFVQRSSDRQSQLQSRMDAYDTRLLAINQKLDHFISEHESSFENIQHVVQFAQITTSALTQLRDIQDSNGQMLSRMSALGTGMGVQLSDTFDALKGILAKILNKLSIEYNDEAMVLSQLQQTVSSIAQNVNSLYDSLTGGGNNELTAEVMQDNLEKLRQTIVYAFRSEMTSLIQSLGSLNSHVSNMGSLGRELRVSLESLYNMGMSLPIVDKMVAEIKQRVSTTCKVHVKGGAGKNFQLSQGQKAEIVRQNMKNRKDTNKNKYVEEAAAAWKDETPNNPQYR